MACCNCLFISQTDFYPIVPLPQIIDGSVIEKVIYSTQIKYIKPLLCEGLYDELCTQIQTDTLSDINEQLFCYIREVHVRYAFADFLFLQPVKVTKESVVRKVSDESEFIDFATINQHVKYWQLEAQTFSHELNQFLKNNIDSNSLYGNCACNCSSSSHHNMDFIGFNIL